MRCERMKATIPTSLCFRLQAQVDKYVKTRKRYSNNTSFDAPNIPAHSCYRCSQGAEVQKNKEKNDMDVEELRKAYPVEITTSLKHRNLQNKERVKRSRERMKEANDQANALSKEPTNFPAWVECQPEDDSADVYTLSVEVGGHRIQLCRECARRYLRI